VQIPTLAEVQEEKTRRRYRRSLSAFVQDAWKVLEPATPLLWSWHQEAMCEHLMAQSSGQIQNLGINVPPRSGKSTIVSVCWPAWEWTFSPGQQWLCGSYAAALALDHALGMRRLILSDWYQRWWSHVFQLAEDQRAKGKFDTDKGGHRISMGAGGPVLGHGGNRLLMDDPHNTKQVESEDVRTGTVDWYGRYWEGRLNDKKVGTRTLVMQRLHEDDVSGMLQERGDYEWLVIPQEFDSKRRRYTKIGWTDPRKKDGELLHPERDGKEEIAAQKRRLGPYGFAGQENQEPSPAGGGMFKRDWWPRYRPFASPMRDGVVQAPSRFDMLILSVDAAFGDKPTGSRVAITVIGTHGPKKFIEYCEAEHMDILVTIAAIERIRKLYPVNGVIIENKANGPAIIQMLRKKVPGVNEYNPKGDKTARAAAIVPQASAGDIHLLWGATWVPEWIDELAKFPKGKFNDRVDSLTQGVTWLDDPENGASSVLAMASRGLG
jgi:predicted phage terminase large subunit-like protein